MSFRSFRVAALAIVLAAVPSATQAQLILEYNLYGADRAPDLQFPREPSRIADIQPRMGLFKPDGPGPFPALVLMHQCDGLVFNNGAANASMLQWAREGVARGYVVLLVDSLRPRDVDSVCLGPKGEVAPSRGVKDALQAAAHMRTLPYVDKKRVVFAGYSWGGGVGLMLSSSRAGRTVGVTDRYDAAVAFYPPCYNYPRARPPNSLVLSGIDRPLLVLFGARDIETPPSECTGNLSSMKEKGAPVEWHIYDNATHCWDCVSLNGFRKVDIRRNSIEYRYDEAITRDSAGRMFAFYQRVFAQSR